MERSKGIYINVGQLHVPDGRVHNLAEEVHHKKELTPKNINDISVTVNPNNIISLCDDCHEATIQEINM